MVSATLRAVGRFAAGKALTRIIPKLASKRFLLLYPDGSRAHISTIERDELLISAKIRKVNEFSYSYTAQPKTFHSFSELEHLRPELEMRGPVRRFLEGRFVIEYPRRLGGRKIPELLETPEGMAIRLQTA